MMVSHQELNNLPWAQGGEHSYNNTQLACRKCNVEKGTTLVV